RGRASQRPHLAFTVSPHVPAIVGHGPPRVRVDRWEVGLMLGKLTRWCYEHRRRVIALWLGTLVAATLLAGAAGGDTRIDFSVPGSDSAEASELLQERFPEFAGGTVDVVYTAEGGITEDHTARIEELEGQLLGVDHVVATERRALGTT